MDKLKGRIVRKNYRLENLCFADWKAQQDFYEGRETTEYQLWVFAEILKRRSTKRRICYVLRPRIHNHNLPNQKGNSKRIRKYVGYFVQASYKCMGFTSIDVVQVLPKVHVYESRTY
uniref:Uncharacterized protein n=1 Tax=Romanomermis culicivorax TaxID=13658 RepID=A0A915HNJ7_ROMCU